MGGGSRSSGLQGGPGSEQSRAEQASSLTHSLAPRGAETPSPTREPPLTSPRERRQPRPARRPVPHHEPPLLRLDHTARLQRLPPRSVPSDLSADSRPVTGFWALFQSLVPSTSRKACLLRPSRRSPGTVHTGPRPGCPCSLERSPPWPHKASPSLPAQRTLRGLRSSRHQESQVCPQHAAAPAPGGLTPGAGHPPTTSCLPPCPPATPRLVPIIEGASAEVRPGGGDPSPRWVLSVPRAQSSEQTRISCGSPWGILAHSPQKGPGSAQAGTLQCLSPARKTSRSPRSVSHSHGRGTRTVPASVRKHQTRGLMQQVWEEAVWPGRGRGGPGLPSPAVPLGMG